eukprot:179211_1
MARVIAQQVVSLYINEYSNGTVVYEDENGALYSPIHRVGSTSSLSTEDDSIINSNITLEEALIYGAICLCLILLGGITSGLNVSLLSIDAAKNELMLKLSRRDPSRCDPTQISMMERVQPLLRDRHLLLVTLLVANASCMEALPIFLDKIVAAWLAVVISVSFVLIFGEIVPQALFTANPLKWGNKLYWVVLTMKWVLFPICKPLAWILDVILKEDHQKKGVTFTRTEVSMIMNEISQHPDERKVVEGALHLSNCTVNSSLIPWQDVDCVDANLKLDADGLRQIYATGHSRIPVFEGRKDNVIGLLLVKVLILCDPDPQLSLKQFLSNFKCVAKPCLVHKDYPLYDLINTFQKKRTHFAMVCEDMKDQEVIEEHWRKGEEHQIKWSGIITMEDVMEDIIQEEIGDEFDAGSPLNAILEQRISETRLSVDTKERPQFTDDESFIKCVNARFTARNKRTFRAMESRKSRDAKEPYSQTVPMDVDIVWDKMKSQSHPQILAKPLLSVQNK